MARLNIQYPGAFATPFASVGHRGQFRQLTGRVTCSCPPKEAESETLDITPIFCDEHMRYHAVRASTKVFPLAGLDPTLYSIPTKPTLPTWQQVEHWFLFRHSDISTREAYEAKRREAEGEMATFCRRKNIQWEEAEKRVRVYLTNAGWEILAYPGSVQPDRDVSWIGFYVVCPAPLRLNGVEDPILSMWSYFHSYF